MSLLSGKEYKEFQKNEEMKKNFMWRCYIKKIMKDFNFKKISSLCIFFRVFFGFDS